MFKDMEYKPSFAKFKLSKDFDSSNTLFYFNHRKEFVCLDSSGDIVYIDFDKLKGGEAFIKNIDRCSINHRGIKMKGHTEADGHYKAIKFG
jgi:hypothetical protein